MDKEHHLDILGQLPNLGIYTQISLCFPASDDLDASLVASRLINGLSQLSVTFPWVASQVVNEGASKGNTGVFKFKPIDNGTSLFILRDLRNDVGTGAMSMESLRQANFPFTMLDESVVAPRHTIPGTSGEALGRTSPVFMAQATLIRGGLLLTFVGHHGSMDMTGLGQVMHLLSKACQHEAFTDEEISSGNIARRTIIPSLDEPDDLEQFVAKQLVKPGIGLAPNSPSAKCTWAYFAFGSSALQDLKARATRDLESGFVSTDDALTTFIWQSVVRSRLSRLGEDSKTSLGRAVDVRKYLGISAAYPGMAQNMTYHTYVARDLATEPLGRIAAGLRRAVDPTTTTLGRDTRALATFLERTPDKTVVSFAATLDLSSDLMISSWVKVDCYGMEFGLGMGKPEAVRRPRFIPFESLVYLLPKGPDGEIIVGLCLRHEDLNRLSADAEFVKYGVYIG